MSLGFLNNPYTTPITLDGLNSSSVQDAIRLIHMYELMQEDSSVANPERANFEELIAQALSVNHGSTETVIQTLAAILYQDYIFSKVGSSLGAAASVSNCHAICHGLRMGFLQFIVHQDHLIQRAYNSVRATWSDQDNAPNSTLKYFRHTIDALAAAQGIIEPRLTHRQKFDFLLPTIRKLVFLKGIKGRIGPELLDAFANSLVDLLVLNEQLHS